MMWMVEFIHNFPKIASSLGNPTCMLWSCGILNLFEPKQCFFIFPDFPDSVSGGRLDRSGEPARSAQPAAPLNLASHKKLKLFLTLLEI